jgi:hypothetical protein
MNGEIDLWVKGGMRELFPLGTNAVILLKEIISNRKSEFVFLNPQTGE